MIIEGVGTHPNSKFIESSNIKLDRKGFIPVNDKFETNVPNIYVIGDIATSHYRHVDLPASVPLAWGLTVQQVLLPNKLLEMTLLNSKAS